MVTKKTRLMGNNKAIHYIKLALLGILAACLLPSGYANAAISNSSEKSSDIEIKIESTRPDLTVGTGLGVMAEVTNLSKKDVIYLHEKYLTLTPAPELISASGELVGWWCFFPSMEHKGTGDDLWNTIATLKPGQSITAFWWAGKPSTPAEKTKPSFTAEFIRNIASTVFSELNFLFFSPGDYKITVSAKYWIHPNMPPHSKDYHLAVQSKSIHAKAPQSVILFGAALGGLFAYFILPQARRKLIKSEERSKESSLYWGMKRTVKEVAGLLAAILLSTIITILLARIAETQFFIRVTVTDLWGAVAIGFIANYAGAEIINKIIKGYSDKQASQAASSEQKKENGNKSGS